MSDSRIIERVKVPFRSAADGATGIFPMSRPARVTVPEATVPLSSDGGVRPDEALQVLTLAQRTGDDHIAAAGRQAQKCRDEARADAERIHVDADLYAEKVRAEADQLLVDARAEAERLDLQARQRYEDAVGGLAIKREALQKQVEALATFDADYRHRIASFVQAQMRELWTGRHRAPDAQPVPAGVPGGPIGTPRRG